MDSIASSEMYIDDDDGVDDSEFDQDFRTVPTSKELYKDSAENESLEADELSISRLLLLK